MWSNLLQSKKCHKWDGIKLYLKSDLFKGISEKEYMYLVHSFMRQIADTIATTNYEVEYASALKKNNF
jgi:glutamine amidotransferase